LGGRGCTIKKIASGNVPKLPDGQPLNGGDLMTVDAFGDFELTWEWKVTPGANSGLKYNVSEELSVKEAPNHAALGFRVSDPGRRPAPGRQAGDASRRCPVRLIAPSRPTHVRPVGEWNESKLVFRGNHGEHWLNGEKLLAFDLGTARMDSCLAKSKFRSLPWFGERRRGHIILQDHGDEVYFKNIKVR